MSTSKNLLFVVRLSSWKDDKIEIYSSWIDSRHRFIKSSNAQSIKIYEPSEDSIKPHGLICEISKKWARFGGIDCVLIQRFCGKRKYKEHQLCEMLDEVPEDIRPLLFKLKG